MLKVKFWQPTTNNWDIRPQIRHQLQRNLHLLTQAAEATWQVWTLSQNWVYEGANSSPQQWQCTQRTIATLISLVRPSSDSWGDITQDKLWRPNRLRLRKVKFTKVILEQTRVHRPGTHPYWLSNHQRSSKQLNCWQYCEWPRREVQLS